MLQVLGIMYNLSIDLDSRSQMAETQIFSLSLQLLLAENAQDVTGCLLPLLVNLTALPEATKLLYRSDELETFFTQALKVCQPLFFKIIRNVSEVEGIKQQLLSILPSLVKLLPHCEPCIQVEIMGVLHNMVHTNSNCNMLNNDSNGNLVDDDFLLYLSNYFSMKNAEDDIVLEMIMFIAGCCTHQTALGIVNAGICMHAFKQFLLFEPTRVELLGYCEKGMMCIVVFSKDTIKLIATLADDILDIISEVDQNWLQKIRRWRFDMHNPTWIQDQEMTSKETNSKVLYIGSHNME
eukprot:Gb_05380 [translate_table: standard]